MPYSRQQFQRFFAELFAASRGIREIAQKAISAMPAAKVMPQLAQRQQQLASNQQRQRIINKMCRKIEQQQQQVQRQKVLLRLSQVPAHGDIPASIASYFSEDKKLLFAVLQDKSGSLALPGEKAWDLLRFLAARVLAGDDDSAVRLRLSNLAFAEFSTRIIVACALAQHKLGWFALNEDAWQSAGKDLPPLPPGWQPGANEFLDGLLVQTLNFSSPREKNLLLAIVRRPLCSLRVRLLALYRFLVKNIYPQAGIAEAYSLARTGCSDPNPVVYAFGY